MGKRREPTEAEKIAEQRKEVADALAAGKTELDLRTQSMDVLREMCAIKTLKKLTLRNLAPLKTLPKEIGQLENLESFHIDGNDLDSLPDEIGALTRVHTFYAYHNKFTTLPETFGQMRSLRKLVLWSNELKALPKSFGNLTKVTEVELKWNKLKSVPDEIARLESLEDLDLQSNELSDLPKDLSGLKKLRRLELGKNKFKELPLGLLTLPALVELDLSENSLKALPDEIAKIATLRELNIEENAITELPKKLFSLPLSSLKMNQNKLKEFPKELAQIRSLIELEVWGNPMKDVDDELARKSKGEIFAQLGLWKPKVAPPPPADKDEILKKYKAKIEKFTRESKRRGGEKLAAVIKFVTGGTDVVPAPALDDESDLTGTLEIFAPYAEWTFVDRRVLAFLTQDAWRFKQPGHDYFSGFDEHVYKWVAEQMKEEPAGSTLFSDLAKEIVAEGIPETLVVEGALRELDEAVLREDGSPTSFGKFLLDRVKTHEALFAVQDRDSVKQALTGLLIRHARETFVRLGDKLLTIAPDEDGETHIPYEALDQACAVEPARFEALVLEAIEKTDCEPCRAETVRILERYYPKHRQKALELARASLAKISERKNKQERYEFSWSGGPRWTDGTGRYIGWMLEKFGGDVHADIFQYVEGTKVFDLDVAEVVAKSLGQKSVDMLAEGLQMTFDDDDIAPHFRRMFALLAPFDWSKHQEHAWKIARSEHKKTRETACLALSRLDPKMVVPKAKEMLAAKKGYEREGGILILSLVGDAESNKTLKELLASEKTDDARDIIVTSFFKEGSCTRAEADARVASAAGRGKLDKPIAKWLDEKKLPKLTWTGGKPLDPQAVRFLLYRQTRQTEIAIDPEARAVLELVDRKKSGNCAEKLLALVLKNGGAAAKNRFALALVGTLGDDRIVPPLEKVATNDRNENAVRTLGLLGSMESARALDRIMKVFRVKYPNVRETAQEAFDGIAEKLGMTPFELADTMIPDFGMKNGKLAIAGTKPPLFAVISPLGKLGLVDGAGAEAKAPKTLAAKPKEAIKALGEEVRLCAKQLKSSIEYYLIVRRRWPRDKWEAFFGENPLAAALGNGFVWASYNGGKLGATFRVAGGSKLLDVDGRPVSLAKDAVVGLAHPLELSANERAKWLTTLRAAGATPSLPQLDRPTFTTTEDERTQAVCARFGGQELAGLTFKGRAERRGWRRGSVVDSGEVSAYRKVFPHDKVEVFVKTEGLNVTSYDDDSEVTLGDVFFVRPGAVVTGSYTYDEPRDEGDDRLIKLGDVPPIVFSEVVADLAGIAKQKEDEADA